MSAAHPPERPVSRRAQIGAAHRAVRKLPKPDGMRPGKWLLLKEVLIVLNGHLPEVCSRAKRDIATKLGISQRNVSHLLVTAEKAGPITRLEKPGRHGERPRHEYVLLYTAPPEPSSAPDQSRGLLGPEPGTSPKSVLPTEEEPRLASSTQALPPEELAAAAAGRLRQNISPNQFPGDCLGGCGRYVEVGEGTWQKDAEGVPQAVCWDCFGKRPGSMDSGKVIARLISERMRAWRALGEPMTTDRTGESIPDMSDPSIPAWITPDTSQRKSIWKELGFD